MFGIVVDFLCNFTEKSRTKTKIPGQGSVGSRQIVGIGGINTANAAQVIRAGADGTAVISCISKNQDPISTVKDLKKEIQKPKK
ncbi:thiamine phosphate synthase [Rossellomorea vietnamensis]|uniref:Thiamine phosphate synthase n=1 Tax=Rossellomorea vietnamensis TaxID=218284 RepID=A0A5D4MBL1_9BACI|nr:thiamine phosphate synthase [Rossellomorea vietnamensis]